ncbi:hypothetical protein BDV24DRAFT_122413 [Aspergillus arachidicola]|uniref:Uncharacterized protein n=1 Tax=Aspergillus arachidicola TaxID=656916 RepID=A0A5N6YNY0_9EURO|nr:hypothetical protein BDV24DRAFT_122413 [Aspergillus arachidicola]
MSLNLDLAGGQSAQSRNHLWSKRRNMRQKDYRELMQRGQKKVSRSTLPIGWMWQFLLAICKSYIGYPHKALFISTSLCHLQR